MVHAEVLQNPTLLDNIKSTTNYGAMQKEKIFLTGNPANTEKLTMEDIVTTEIEKQFQMELDMIYNSYQEYLKYQYELGILDVATEEEELIDFLSVFENFFKQETAKPDLDPEMVDGIVDSFIKNTGKLITKPILIRIQFAAFLLKTFNGICKSDNLFSNFANSFLKAKNVSFFVVY